MTFSPPVPRADGCLLTCWQVYDKVFAIFNQVSSFTPISGPEWGKKIVENKKKEYSREVLSSLYEIVLFDNNNMRTVCSVWLSPYLPAPALTSGWSYIIANQLTLQIYTVRWGYQLIRFEFKNVKLNKKNFKYGSRVVSLRSPLAFLLFVRLLQALQECSQQCLIYGNRLFLRGDPTHSKLSLSEMQL